MNFDNVTLYDYGFFETVTIYDTLYDIYTGAYSGYGNIDQISVITPDLVGGFYQVSADQDSSYLVDFDPTGNYGTFTDPLGNTASYTDMYRFTRTDQSDETLVNHGTGLLRHYTRL